MPLQRSAGDVAALVVPDPRAAAGDQSRCSGEAAARLAVGGLAFQTVVLARAWVWANTQTRYGETVNNNGPDEAAGADLGGNVDSDGTCFAPATTGDLTSTDPKLATLGDNGGQTPTDALLAGSPAIGHALSSAPTCSSADQRGVNRLSSFCDPGAYQTIDADLALSGSGPSTVKAGQQIADKFTVSNGGPYAAGGVTFTATISSANFSLDAVTASQGCGERNVADVRRPHGDPELLARDADLGPDRRSADGHRYGQADAGPSGDLEQPGDRQRVLA